MSIQGAVDRRQGEAGERPGHAWRNPMTALTSAPRFDIRTALHLSFRTFARVALGLIFVVCGLNGFLDFLPHPTAPIPDGALSFAGALMGSGYFFPLLKGTEVLAGALLLSNRLVPLALIILAPVIVNIVAFHAFLAPSGLGLALILLVLEASLAWSYRAAYRPLFSSQTPGTRTVESAVHVRVPCPAAAR